MAAAERTAAEEGWLDPRRGPQPDSLYGHVPARAFFRAKMALARFLMDGSYHRDARVIYKELLRRDRNDHMGARYEVIQIYHADDDHEALGCAGGASDLWGLCLSVSPDRAANWTKKTPSGSWPGRHRATVPQGCPKTKSLRKAGPRKPRKNGAGDRI